ncbi:MAG: hypothetical protein QXD72_02045 [Candidatus Aenigmatarchaeota archaeon]
MKTKFENKRRPLSKGWEKIITEGSKTPPKITYRKIKYGKVSETA